MATSPPSPIRRAFGPFEVSAGAGELRKSGVRIRLSGQPFQILIVLLERPGDLVTREELREKLWNYQTFVDFEHGLNAAINKLRRSLGDSAERPKYIETVKGRGYRFIGSVREVKEPNGNSFVGPASDLETGRIKAVATEESQPADRPTTTRKQWIAAAALATLAAVGLAFSYFQRPGVLTVKDMVVLADFLNTTGDPVFDETLRQGLSVELQQSPFLSLVSEERIHTILRLMGRPSDARLTPELAREICERTAGAAVLEGSIASLGSRYVLWFSAKNCSTGEILDQEQVQATRKEDVLNALTQISRKFRTRAGESLATVKKHATPLAEATTPSLEALQAYSSAWKVAFSTGFASAVPLLKRSLEIDPKFAMAHAFLGRMYADIGETVLSAASISKAYELRDRASDRERFFIALSYDLQVTGNLEKARQTGELWAQIYPRDPVPHGFLSGFISQGSGNYEKSIDEARKAIALDPDFTPGYSNLAFGFSYLDRFGEAERALQSASDRNLEIADILVLRYYIAFFKGDRAGMQRQVRLAQGKAGAEDWMSHHEALVLAQSGHLHQAELMWKRAIGLAEQAEETERAAIFETATAVCEAVFGNALAARTHARAALELSKGRDVEYGAAFALGFSGDSSAAQRLTDDLETRFPEDTSVRFNYLPTLRAMVALDHQDPTKALDYLQMALPHDFAIPGAALFGFFGGLYPAYVGGEAHLAAHQGAKAAAEFKKILSHRGIVFSDPISALAPLQIGRALVTAGDLTKAKSAYEDFLSLWRDADPEIPILKQAKAEYAEFH